MSCFEFERGPIARLRQVPEQGNNQARFEHILLLGWQPMPSGLWTEDCSELRPEVSMGSLRNIHVSKGVALLGQLLQDRLQCCD
jgi:hypothetical protein